MIDRLFNFKCSPAELIIFFSYLPKDDNVRKFRSIKILNVELRSIDITVNCTYTFREIKDMLSSIHHKIGYVFNFDKHFKLIELPAFGISGRN